ncbi:MAG: hypothetical protein AAF988_06525, partial [Pseudomonadota bacterium]
EAFTQGDTKILHDTAHALKANCLSLGVVKVAELSAHIEERTGKILKETTDENLYSLESWVKELSPSMEKVMPHLKDNGMNSQNESIAV